MEEDETAPLYSSTRGLQLIPRDALQEGGLFLGHSPLLGRGVGQPHWALVEQNRVDGGCS